MNSLSLTCMLSYKPAENLSLYFVLGRWFVNVNPNNACLNILNTCTPACSFPVCKYVQCNDKINPRDRLIVSQTLFIWSLCWSQLCLLTVKVDRVRNQRLRIWIKPKSNRNINQLIKCQTLQSKDCTNLGMTTQRPDLIFTFFFFFQLQRQPCPPKVCPLSVILLPWHLQKTGPPARAGIVLLRST